MSSLSDFFGLGNPPGPGAPKESSYKTAIRDFGNLLGAMADISGGIGLVSTIIGLFSGGDDALEALSEEMVQFYKNLSVEISVASDLSTLAEISTQMANARAVYTTVTGSPGPYDSPQVQMDLCGAAANALQGDTWQMPFLESNYWTDEGKYQWLFWNALDHLAETPQDFGYGRQVPDHNGAAFNYIYFLPAYLEALTMYTTVGKKLFPDDFLDRYGGDLKKKTDFLEKQYNRMLSGITHLAPTAWTRDTLIDGLKKVFVFVVTGITPLNKDPSVKDGFFLRGSPVAPLLMDDQLPMLGGVDIEYGAVEKFSACSSMGDYNITLDEIKAMPSDSSPYDKFQIRLWKRVIDVSIAIGLSDAWLSINSLRALLGNDPLPRPTVSDFPIDWSFRGLVWVAKIVPRTDSLGYKEIHLSDFVKFLENTPPHDTPPGKPTSFRALLV